MRAVAQTHYKIIFSLFALLLLSACGSEMTSIDAPESTEPGQTFEVSATHEFIGQNVVSPELVSPALGSPAGVDETILGALAFGVFVTEGWTGSPTASYQGTWDGTPVDLDLELLDAIPETNLLEYMEGSGDSYPPEILEFVAASDCATVIDELGGPDEGDFDFLFYQTTGSLIAGPDPQTGDSGEFSFDLTAGSIVEEGEVVVIHALLFGETNIEGSGQDVLGCFWYPDIELSDGSDLYIPSAVFTTILMFGSDLMPVPVMGGAMMAILSLLLAIVGIVMGRRRSTQHG